MAMPAVPGTRLVVRQPELGLGGLKRILASLRRTSSSFAAGTFLSGSAQQAPSTFTSVSSGVPAGHPVAKKTRSRSMRWRRTSRPRVQAPGER